MAYDIVTELKQRIKELEAQLEAERAVNAAQLRDRKALEAENHRLIAVLRHFCVKPGGN
jgi:regulator of replication initiation timing